MIAEVCFTCKRHQQLAFETDSGDAAVRRIWCVAPEDADMLPPRGVELRVRDFDRNRNLNGWECVAGLLAVFEELFAAGATTVVKRDSDTRVLRYDGLVAAHGFAGVGVRKTQVEPWQFFGACYSLSPLALPVLRAAIAARVYRDEKVPEDQFFSWALRECMQVLGHERASFVRNHDRTREQEPLWANAGNRWEGDAWYAAQRAAREAAAPKSVEVVTATPQPITPKQLPAQSAKAVKRS